MENPKIRFKGFTKDGNSVSWGMIWFLYILEPIY